MNGRSHLDVHDEDEAFSDESSLPPPPPPAEIEFGAPSAGGTERRPETPVEPKTEDEKYHEQLKIFKGLALFGGNRNRSSNANPMEKPVADDEADANNVDAVAERDLDTTGDEEMEGFVDDGSGGGDDDDDDDANSVEVPLGSKIDRTGQNKSGFEMTRSTMYWICAGILLLIIVIILAVGLATGAFSGGGSGTGGGGGGESPTSPNDNGPNFTPDPNEPERASRLREYLSSVGANGGAAFNDPISPESQALTWMQNEDPAQLDPIEFSSHLRIDQRFALLTVWFQSEQQWFDETNWLTEDECTWFGVTCFTVTPGLRRKLNEGAGKIQRKLQDGDKLVALLDLDQNNLQGNVPPDLYLLQYLKTLNLSNNRMSSSIPSTVGQMSFLEELYLDNNALTGELTMDFSEMADLRVLHLSVNQLEGPIPDSFWSSTRLQEVHLDGNAMTGTISEEVGNLQALSKFA